ncbi:trehalose-phosphatase [Paracoccus saliphilus]|uniref:Trehalose 6-phosphate phosphatase n=1 Tax=Paracoccus saliphilus TaxID=405559 RepID=A0AA45W6H8_9RHOB|nr:trehalose-phosphatase [Paracoccus saliphilus]WCR04426.1 trehalose-phosphatase [Paracoccus saliphilus]SIT01521.1 trehalose 6-phosphatase [Paracoccus saliphilus]
MTIPPRLPPDAALFLDFDGCLVDIAPTPDAVVIPDDLPGLLDRMHRRQGGALALISGREVADLRRFLPDFPGGIAGSHGAELALPGQKARAVNAQALDVAALHARTRDLAARHDGLMVEPKAHGVVLHYRAVPDLAEWAAGAMAELAGDYPMLALQPAKMAFELRPAEAGKDRALARFMDMPGFAGRIPVYAGDDLTDEAGMAEAQSRGGFGIKIGEGQSCAKYRLENPRALRSWLDSACRS